MNRRERRVAAAKERRTTDQAPAAAVNRDANKAAEFETAVALSCTRSSFMIRGPAGAVTSGQRRSENGRHRAATSRCHALFVAGWHYHERNHGVPPKILLDL